MNWLRSNLAQGVVSSWAWRIINGVEDVGEVLVHLFSLDLVYGGLCVHVPLWQFELLLSVVFGTLRLASD